MLELRSDLGGGKTTFTRGLARGAGSKDMVASPTFTLSKIYEGKGALQIHHFDFYRLNEPGVVADQLAESLRDKKTVTVVEWGKIVADVLPKARLSVVFEPVETNPDERKVTIVYSEELAGLVKNVEAGWAVSQP